jgi:uncharacterized protein (TIGR03435 family)
LNFKSSLVPIITAGILLFSAAASAQISSSQTPIAPLKPPSAATKRPAFEVASIHLVQGPLRVFRGFTASGPRLTLEGYNLRVLIEEAYNLRGYRVSFAGSNMPGEESDTNYVIAAKADGEGSPTKDEFRQMLQGLLAERFKFRFHWETKEMPVYAMVVGKNGPKFKQGTTDEISHTHTGVHGRNQTVTSSKETMESFADDINNSFGAELPVIDMTRLTGRYDIQFEATPEWRIDNNPQPEDISLFDAVQDQLGLKLDRQKAAVEVLVVDHIEKPSEN